MALSPPGTFARRLSKHLASVRRGFLNELQGRPERKEELTPRFAPVPSYRELRELLNIAFFASVLREEGRDVTFALEWAPPASSFLLPIDARLERPVRLEPQTLAKLSPALGSPNSLAVTGPTLQGWAIVPREDFPTLQFHLLVRRPGALLVSYAFQTHFTYEAGAGLIMGSDDEPDEDHHARVMLESALANTEAFPAKWKVDALFDIAIECAQEGHGATLILLPTSDVPRQVVTRSHFTLPGQWSMSLSSTLHTLHEPRENTPAEREHYRQAVRAVARLASIDGALLLDPELRVLGFGTILACAPYDGSVKPRNRPRGARHNAAINFVGQFGSAAAVVISQDSRVTAIAKSGGAVKCIRAAGLRWSTDPFGEFPIG